MDLLPHPPLTGSHVRLEPLCEEHLSRLLSAAREGRDSYALTFVPGDEAQMRVYVQRALAERAEGKALPYATIALPEERVVGSTRFTSIERWDYTPHLHPAKPGPDVVEIGYTWLAASAQRTAINSEAKLLMLRHAFEVLEVERVTIKTDARNVRSRRAIERLGAQLEGILRRHMPSAAGGVRDTAMYSLLPAEWPATRAALSARLERR